MQPKVIAAHVKRLTDESQQLRRGARELRRLSGRERAVLIDAKRRADNPPAGIAQPGHVG
jgi:hypothetical protein